MFKPEDFEKFKDTMKSQPPAARSEQFRTSARRFRSDRQALLDAGTGELHPLRSQAVAGLAMLSEQAWALVSHCVDDPSIVNQPIRQAYPPSRAVRQEVGAGLDQLLAQRRAAQMEEALPATRPTRGPCP